MIKHDKTLRIDDTRIYQLSHGESASVQAVPGAYRVRISNAGSFVTSYDITHEADMLKNLERRGPGDSDHG